jgi:3-hydroxyacyl-[acyl-carrier-protein] dehydratase
MRFYLVDKITNIELGKSIEGIKCWSLSDEVFNEHFPGYPVVPGVFLIESMAQTAGILIEKTRLIEYPDDHGIFVILSIVHKAKFRKIIVPGDKCIIHVLLKTLDVNRATVAAQILVENELMAEADLSFAIGSRKDLPENKFIERREEYLNVLFMKNTQREI